MGIRERQIEWATWLSTGFPDLGLRGWSLLGACAVTGNCTQENECLPVTKGTKDHGSDGGLQWRLGRLTDMRSWCDTHFGAGAWKTIKAQCAFTLHETARDYKALDAGLRAGSKSLETLTVDFCHVFERPNMALANLGFVPGKGSGRKGRINFAYDTMAAMRSAPRPGPVIVPAAGVGAAGGAAAAWRLIEGYPLDASIFLNVILGLVAVVLGIALWRASKRHVEILGEHIPLPAPDPALLIEAALDKVMATGAADSAAHDELRTLLASFEDAATKAKEKLK